MKASCAALTSSRSCSAAWPVFCLRDSQIALIRPIRRAGLGHRAVSTCVLISAIVVMGEQHPPRLGLDINPYLPKALVETTRPASYKVLMPGVAA
jgi:hypothetical protein